MLIFQKHPEVAALPPLVNPSAFGQPEILCRRRRVRKAVRDSKRYCAARDVAILLLLLRLANVNTLATRLREPPGSTRGADATPLARRSASASRLNAVQPKNS